MSFIAFRDKVNKQIRKMESYGELFIVDAEKDMLWEKYLAAFPQGTDPIFRERTTHDCNCCKQFIKAVGRLVAIKGNTLVSIWDIQVDDETYQTVADNLSEFVKACKIKDIFRFPQSKIGQKNNVQTLADNDRLTWDHFYFDMSNEFVIPSNSRQSIEQIQGEARNNYNVLKRSVNEITPEAVETVLELIKDNSLYRGEEHLRTVETLKKLQGQYKKAKNKDVYLWEASTKIGPAVRIRNSVIGTLMVDLSDGVDLERAVGSFESKVAPTNYKRSKSLITQKMIDNAEKTIAELGLADALQRRYATERDLTVNNVLYVDRDTKPNMKGESGILGVEPTVKKPKTVKNAKKIDIGNFMDDILPKAKSVEVLVENRHVNNFMSVIGPVNSRAGNITKWDNNFTWSYSGEVTDSIKQRVKRAGGNVDGVIRASLSWFNTDDLDIHVKTPRNEIFYGNRRVGSATLDVDMNVSPQSTSPVENVVWSDMPADGLYQVYIHQFNKRNSHNVGFEVEFDIMGNSVVYQYEKIATGNTKVLDFRVKNGKVEIVKEYLKNSSRQFNHWGVDTQEFHKVKMAMLSPNHWDGQKVGNKHWFFILEGCENPEDSRGFYNEFLRDDLTEHRKVFEVVSSKMKVPHSSEQLSGLGFSSTKKESFTCRVVSDNMTQVFEVNI